MSNLDDLKLFNIGEAELKLWTFKKQSPPGRPPSMNGHWVAVTPEMASELKDILYDAVNSPTELFEYTHLAQNNEGSLLALPADETHMQLLVDSSANPTQSRKTRNIKTIYNALF